MSPPPLLSHRNHHHHHHHNSNSKWSSSSNSSTMKRIHLACGLALIFGIGSFLGGLMSKSSTNGHSAMTRSVLVTTNPANAGESSASGASSTSGSSNTDWAFVPSMNAVVKDTSRIMTAPQNQQYLREETPRQSSLQEEVRPSVFRLVSFPGSVRIEFFEKQVLVTHVRCDRNGSCNL